MEGLAVAEQLHRPGDLPVTRLSWRAAGRPPVVLYRVEGGGHTWPGGGQYLPARIIGPVARTLDATGLMLAEFRAQETMRP
jgi:polyhydroxybutyrate depolymerase